jgi:preprotein translocase subunit YajC
MIDTAYAMGTAPGGAGAQGGGFAAFIPLIIIFVIFYFLLIRPQQKKAKEHRKFLDNLKMGDNVLTVGGLHGTVTGLTDQVITLEIADKVRVKVARSYIAGVSPPQRESAEKESK